MRKSIIKILVVTVLIFLFSSCFGFNGKILQVHFLNVGSADSILVMLPNGQTMLIDAGRDARGEEVVKYLKKKNISKIDYLIATHPHIDHIGGLDTVIKNMNIGEIYMPKISENTKAYKDVLELIKKKKLTVKTAKAGVTILNEGKLDIEIIAPTKDHYDALNDYSAVIKLVYNKRSFLFMGDAQTESENSITADVSADVIKVGHHGSETSTTDAFLERVKPKYAVISVSDGKSYDYPNAKVVRLLENYCLEVFQTNKDGTIIFKTNGTDLHVKHE